MRYLSVTLVMCMVMMALQQCVPAEQKEIQNELFSLNEATLRSIYNVQQAQHRDSLILLLSSEDATTRYGAARAFASIQDSTALKALIPLLSDPYQEIRSMAAYAMGQLGQATAEGPLTAAFDGRDSARMYESSNAQILEAVGKLGSAQYLSALGTISNYMSGDTMLLLGQVRGIYRYALRQMTNPDATATIIRYLADPKIAPDVRRMAAQYLHRAKDIDLTPHLDQLMANWHADTDPFIRMCLATALGKTKSEAARDLLISGFDTESDYRVQCNILRALQEFDYNDIAGTFYKAAASPNPAIAEVASQYFVTRGREKDTGKYRTVMAECPSWQAKTRMAEACNKYTTSMFSSVKSGIQKDIQAALNAAGDPYEKAAWLKAWGAELRNFESIPKYISKDQPAPVRVQAVTTLIESCRDKNFDTYFAGEGHLIKMQIAGYLGNAIRTGDAGMLAIIAEAITDPETGLKAAMNDKRADLNKALAALKLPDEMETYMAIDKALKTYGMDAPTIPEEQKKIKPINWTILQQVKLSSKAIISTTKGDILMELYPDRAPSSVSNFIELAQNSFYNDKPFHRVVPNFVIQTGCPRGDGYGSLDFTLRSELANAYYDDEGYVGMASAGPHTEGTQFFITHSPTPHLDGRYTIFGKVISGMDVVHRIAVGDRIKSIQIQF